MYRQRLVSPALGGAPDVQKCTLPGSKQLSLTRRGHSTMEKLSFSQSDVDREKAAMKRRQQRKMLHELHRCMARSGARAVAASAELFHQDGNTPQVDGTTALLDDTSKFRKRNSPGGPVRGRAGSDVCDDASTPASSVLTWALGPVAFVRTKMACATGQLQDLLCSLSNAIGESPQSRRAALNEEEEQEMPLSMLWVVNLIIISIVASVILVAWAFMSQYDPEEAEAPQAAIASSAPRADRPQRRLSVGVFALGSFSFAAGAGLHMMHPAQSAMLLAV